MQCHIDECGTKSVCRTHATTEREALISTRSGWEDILARVRSFSSWCVYALITKLDCKRRIQLLCCENHLTQFLIESNAAAGLLVWDWIRGVQNIFPLPAKATNRLIIQHNAASATSALVFTVYMPSTTHNFLSASLITNQLAGSILYTQENCRSHWGSAKHLRVPPHAECVPPQNISRCNFSSPQKQRRHPRTPINHIIGSDEQRSVKLLLLWEYSCKCCVSILPLLLQRARGGELFL